MRRVRRVTGRVVRRAPFRSDGRVPRGRQAISHVRRAPNRSGCDRIVKKAKSSWKLKSLCGDFGRLPEGQEGAGFSGVRQKDRRTLSWVESG